MSELYQLIQGDALEAIDTLPQGQIEAIITDPPYSSGARRDAERQVQEPKVSRSLERSEWFSHDTMTSWGHTWFLRSLFVKVRPKMADGAHVYVFSDWWQTPNVYAILESAGCGKRFRENGLTSPPKTCIRTRPSFKYG
ncbi:MAG: hypothetical protein OXG96_03800 [Acidobacteria bacterium]|nr:hypothetical protein [Acidobacteriota bacterium]